MSPCTSVPSSTERITRIFEGWGGKNSNSFYFATGALIVYFVGQVMFLFGTHYGRDDYYESLGQGCGLWGGTMFVQTANRVAGI